MSEMSDCLTQAYPFGIYDYATNLFQDQFSLDPPANLTSFGTGFSWWEPVEKIGLTSPKS